MRFFLRWWDTLDRPERIVAMSLVAGGTIAITNSVTWAVAVCYITRQKTHAKIAVSQATDASDRTPRAAPVTDRMRATGF